MVETYKKTSRKTTNLNLVQTRHLNRFLSGRVSLVSGSRLPGGGEGGSSRKLVWIRRNQSLTQLHITPTLSCTPPTHTPLWPSVLCPLTQQAELLHFMELDLQSLFGLNVHSCTHWLRPRTPLPPPFPHLGSYTRALLVSQDRRHLFVTPCYIKGNPIF